MEQSVPPAASRGNARWAPLLILPAAAFMLVLAYQLAHLGLSEVYSMTTLVWVDPYESGFWTSRHQRVVTFRELSATYWSTMALTFAFPMLALVVAWRRHWPLGVACGGVLLMPMFCYCAIELFDERSMLNEEIFRLVVYGMLASAVILAALVALRRAEPAQPAGSAGVAANPFVCWVVLVLGFVALQVAVPFSTALNDTLWSVLRILDISRYGESWFRGPNFNNKNQYAHMIVYYSIYYMSLYLLPFLFIIYAVWYRMRPVYAIAIGLLAATIYAANELLMNDSYRNREMLTQAMILSQLFGIIGFVVLAAYHHHVSKLQFADHAE